ncbi:MAG: SIR2 family protein [Methylococcales bacterium]
MTIEIQRLVSELTPTNTVLFFGAGASVASHAPSVSQLFNSFKETFNQDYDGYTFREYTGIIENRFTRNRLIEELRKSFKGIKPTGSLLNLPLYEWKSLYTTNYDTLIEECYIKQKKDLTTYISNFDFTTNTNPNATKLFKLHGSINSDTCDGHLSRMIITDTDYDHTQTYREGLYDRFRADLYGANLIIIGHSLADEDIKSIANRAAEISTKTEGVGKVTLLMYTEDIPRAELWEQRGFQVCFGGLDDLFSALTQKLPYSTTVFKDTSNPLDYAPILRSMTVEVNHALSGTSNINSIFNGWPASYVDIQDGLTFKRSLSNTVDTFLDKPDSLCSTILGASGVGKTTTARQINLALSLKDYICWEHKVDFELIASEWANIARRLNKSSAKGALFIDEAHLHLHQINLLVDILHSEHIFDLKLILVSSKNHWNPRIKTPAIYKSGHEFSLGKLRSEEIDGLLNLIDSKPAVRALVEDSFTGFSRYEKRRRLVDRCEAETFVCLKNIFSSEKFDDIILREFASLDTQYQEIYRIVAAMESSGIRVHRQLIIRLLNIPASYVNSALTNLTDIIHEYTINEREGIYGWRGRHSVIVSLLTKYKYQEISMFIELFERVIDAISPTFDIEIRTIRELCNIDTGLPRIPDKNIQNRLLRKMMSVAPAERVPRHKLIRNLIEMGDFEKAEGEIRIFEKDFGRDAPVTRYRINILIGRALHSVGILEEDRIAILYQARDASKIALAKFPDNKTILGAYCEVGIQIYRKNADFSVYDDGMKELKTAEVRIGDPDISALISKYERRLSGQAIHISETQSLEGVAVQAHEETPE